MIIERRKFLTGLFAAPAIIAADRLMPVKVIPTEAWVNYGAPGFSNNFWMKKTSFDVFNSYYTPNILKTAYFREQDSLNHKVDSLIELDTTSIVVLDAPHSDQIELRYRPPEPIRYSKFTTKNSSSIAVLTV